MTELDRKIKELNRVKNHLEHQLNAPLGATITILPSKAAVDLHLVKNEINKLEIQKRIEKIKRITTKINDKRRIKNNN